MHKVLLVAVFDPFTVVPGGSFRILPLVRYLPDFGWEPVVLTVPLKTRPPFPCEVVETPYQETLGWWKRLLKLNPAEDEKSQVKRRLGITARRSFLDYALGFIGEIFYYPDPYKGWWSSAVAKGSELLLQQDFKAILSCHPVTSHLVVAALKAQYNIPWLADLPDLWSQNHNYSYSRWRRRRDAKLEQRTLASADALVTVSEPWAEKLRVLHKGKPVYAITHGFNPDETNDPPAPLSGKFTITYTGSIYPIKQDPFKLLMALSRLTSHGVIKAADVEVRFYGPKYDWLENETRRLGLGGIVKQYGVISHDMAVAKQRESQLLLLLKWEDPGERGCYTTKIFEYLAARRPILATGGYQDVVSQLLAETKAGVDAPTVTDIENTLARAYQEYLTGQVTYHGDGAVANRYSQREMTRKFATVLDGFL